MPRHKRDHWASLDKDCNLTSSLIDRLVLAGTSIIFCVAIFVLFREFASVSPRDVSACLAALPKNKFFAAAGLTGASYLLLTGYDFLALRYVQRRLRFGISYLPRSQPSHSATTSDSSFRQVDDAISHLFKFWAQHHRDRRNRRVLHVHLRTRRIIVSGLLVLLDPVEIALRIHTPQSVISAVGLVMLGASVAYLAVAAVWREPIAFGRYRLRPPSLILAASQVALASVDAVLAGTVMYGAVAGRFWRHL